ncbi:MAG: BrnT family toxin [Deltaproteobacteria bacterium]|nr:BrnT family toxin [Deltaproteobacteria bacterium]
MKFEWDTRKARRNLRGHGIEFNEASTVFADTLSITIPDPDHSEDEERWLTMGLSSRRRLLVVVHTEEEESIRIISARLANRVERRKYEEGDS